MYIGQLLLKGLVAHTPWEPRGGDKGVFSIEVIAKSTNATLDADIEHKNEADPDSAAATVASFTQMDAVGVGTEEATAGFKELVRLKLTINSAEVADDEWLIVDVMAPSWRKN